MPPHPRGFQSSRELPDLELIKKAFHAVDSFTRKQVRLPIELGTSLWAKFRQELQKEVVDGAVPRAATLNGIFAELGLPPLQKRIPYGAARAVGAVLEGAWGLFNLAGEPPMTRFVAAQLGTSHYYDLSAARRDLGYEAVVAPKTALARTIPWLKAEIAAGRL